MSNASPSTRVEFDLATEHLRLIDPTGKLRLGWALKNEHTGQWLEQKPTTAARIISKVSSLPDSTHTSVYICQAPRKPGAKGRTGGQAYHPSLVWADYDADMDDKGGFPDRLIAPGGPLHDYVNMALSGRKGNRHLTLEVAHTDKHLSVDSLRLLNYLTALLFHADMSCWQDAAVLRLWGSYNYRPSKGLHDPVQVRVVQRATKAIAAKDLLKILVAELDIRNVGYYKQQSKTPKHAELTVCTATQDELLRRVAPGLRMIFRRNDLSLFGGGNGDESQKLYNLYREVLQNSDLDDNELYTLMMSFEPFVDRMSHRPEAEISNAYSEFLNSEDRQEARKQFLMKRQAPKAEPVDEDTTFTEDDFNDEDQETPSWIWNDNTNARWLIQTHAENFFALESVQGHPLYYWDGSIWTHKGALAHLENICMEFQDGLSALNERGNYSLELYRKGRSRATRNNMIATLKNQVLKPAEELDADPTLLHMGSAIYDTKTGTIREPRREDFITKRTRATYDPDATCPEFELQMKQCLPDVRLREYTSWFFSRSIDGRPQKTIAVFVGRPDSGKSALVRAVAHPLGDYSKTVADDVALIKPGNSHKANLHSLRDARLGLVSEPSKGQKFNIDQLKGLSGGDEQTSNAMRGNYETWVPRLQLLVTCNTVPNMGDDEGLLRRLKFIEFTHVIPKEDQNDTFAQDVLYPEADGILRWLVETHQFYIGKEPPRPPRAVERMGRQIAISQNPVAEFIGEMLEAGNLIVDPDSRLDGKYLYENVYLKWFRDLRLKGEALKIRDFYGALRKMGYEIKSSNKTMWCKGLADGTPELEES